MLPIAQYLVADCGFFLRGIMLHGGKGKGGNNILWCWSWAGFLPISLLASGGDEAKYLNHAKRGGDAVFYDWLACGDRAGVPWATARTQRYIMTIFSAFL